MHGQSRGKISLAGPTPDADPIIDLNCLSHPYDTRVMVESLKKTLDFVDNSSLPVGNSGVRPSSTADEDILVGPVHTLIGFDCINRCLEICEREYQHYMACARYRQDGQTWRRGNLCNK